MATPFISVLEPPTDLTSYNRSLPSSQQHKPGQPSSSSSIPKTFLDAMEVREQVYVQEQKVPLEYEHDSDDTRSVHWVIYASINQTIEPEIRDPSTQEIIRPRRSESRAMPIGTIRLVPFPHPPHPRKGGIYVDGRLTNAGDPVSKVGEPGSSFPTNTIPSASPTTTAPENIPKDSEIVQPLTPSEETRLSSSPIFIPFGVDPPTTYHDGVEPYVKLGRLAVLKEFRGRGIASQLIRAAIDWMVKHRSAFNPSAAILGFETLGMTDSRTRTRALSTSEDGNPTVTKKAVGAGDVPKWRGLFCVHAQEDAVQLWEKHGFKVDEAMGRWLEEGIPHVGMFYRAPGLDGRSNV
ncbi:hypothetical protein V8F20_002774 [Naviculisporaceae sp. PSN 640]